MESVFRVSVGHKTPIIKHVDMHMVAFRRDVVTKVQTAKNNALIPFMFSFLLHISHHALHAVPILYFCTNLKMCSILNSVTFPTV